MKGSRLSQRGLAELVREVEDRKASERLTAMENAFEKKKWTAELERRRKLSTDEPDPISHPEDIFIDMRTSVVRTEGHSMNRSASGAKASRGETRPRPMSTSLRRSTARLGRRNGRPCGGSSVISSSRSSTSSMSVCPSGTKRSSRTDPTKKALHAKALEEYRRCQRRRSQNRQGVS
jgi:hypothetical protein